MKYKQWIPAVAGKLEAESMTRESYNYEKAKEILGECIAPHLCIDTLTQYESEIKELL